MNHVQKYFLIDEVYYHCNSAVLSFTELFSILNNYEHRQSKLVWNKLLGGLTHCSIVSNYFFSSKRKAKNRTQFLQDEINPSKPNPLDNSDARNYLIHIDEKFDFWIDNEDSFSGFLESVFDNRKSYEFLRLDKKYVRRVFLIEEKIFIFQLGKKRKEIAIEPIFNELNKIMQNTLEYARKLENESQGILVIQPLER